MLRWKGPLYGQKSRPWYAQLFLSRCAYRAATSLSIRKYVFRLSFDLFQTIKFTSQIVILTLTLLTTVRTQPPAEPNARTQPKTHRIVAIACNVCISGPASLESIQTEVALEARTTAPAGGLLASRVPWTSRCKGMYIGTSSGVLEPELNLTTCVVLKSVEPRQETDRVGPAEVFLCVFQLFYSGSLSLLTYLCY